MNRITMSFEAPKLVLDKCDFCGRFLFAGEPQVACEVGPSVRRRWLDAAARVSATDELPQVLRQCPHWPQPSPAAGFYRHRSGRREVFAGAFRSICLEMGNTMIRTAHSPVFYEAKISLSQCSIRNLGALRCGRATQPSSAPSNTASAQQSRNSAGRTFTTAT